MAEGILLDTNFLIRLLNPNDRLHTQTREFYAFFLQRGLPIWLSTVALAEYCVRGRMDELPLRHLRILPFNVSHAVLAGRLAARVFQAREQVENLPRRVIANDVKLLAQAEEESSIRWLATSDKGLIAMHGLLQQEGLVRLEIIDINQPLNPAQFA